MKKKHAISWLYNELPGLIKQGVITPDTADSLRSHYGEVNVKSRMQVVLTIFASVGAICVGLGVILLFAYNWDALNRFQRTCLAFLPLIISQLLLAFAILTGRTSGAAREGFAVFNVLATGGAIALISQIYHLPGDFDRFLLTWSLLALPLVYIMSSNLTAVLYMIGITSWAGASQLSGGHALLFWPLAALIVPYYINIVKDDPYSSRSVWLSAAFCVCLTVSIGTSLEKVLPGLWIVVYSSYFAVLYLASKIWFDDAPAFWQKPFRNYGISGLLILSYIFTYEHVWRRIGFNYYRHGGRFHEYAGIADYAVAAALLVVVVWMIVRIAARRDTFELSFGALPLLAVVGYSLSGFGGNTFISVWIFNLYVLYLGILCVMTGMREKHLGITNAGVLIMGGIIFTRFIDSSLSIIPRALIFIVIGACFIGTNMVLGKNMKAEGGDD